MAWTGHIAEAHLNNSHATATTAAGGGRFGGHASRGGSAWAPTHDAFSPPPPSAAILYRGGAHDHHNREGSPSRANHGGGGGGVFNQFLGHTPMTEDTSPPTSPPSSVAPQSEDEFTALILRRAAARLGVEYSPGRSRHLHHATMHHRSASQAPPVASLAPQMLSPVAASDRDRATLLAMARTQHLPASGPQSWALYGECTVDDLHAMIKIRERALGPSHRSLATLQDALGDRQDIEGNPQIARSHYETALRLMPAEDKDRAAVLGKLGYLMLRLGDPILARDYFTRAADLAESGRDPAVVVDPDDENSETPTSEGTNTTARTRRNRHGRTRLRRRSALTGSAN